MASSELSIYENSGAVSNLKTFNYVPQADGTNQYVPVQGDPLGEQRLYVQVKILEVGDAPKAGTTGSAIPSGESYTKTGDKDATVRLMVDTGSWETVIPEKIVREAFGKFDSSLYPTAQISYSSSGNTATGVWVPLKLQFTTTDGKTAITTIPVIVDTGPSPAYMMGIGFNVGRGDPTQAVGTTTAGNAFLNLDAMNDGTMLRGYVINETGIHLGLSTSDVGSGWAFQKLQPSLRVAPHGAPSDWQPATVSGTVGDGVVPAGSLLMDTGLPNSYIKTTDALPQPAAGTPVVLNLLGTQGAVGYRYLLDGNSAMAPSLGSVSPTLLTGPSPTGTFVNTGGHFLSGFDYLYDASNGFLGLRSNGAGPHTDVTVTPLISVSGTVPLPDGFATTLPLFLTGATSLALVGTATLSGGLSGAGALSIQGGTVTLSGPGTLDGALTLAGGATLKLGNVGVLGAAGGTVSMQAGTTLDLPAGATLAQGLKLAGAATVGVAPGAETTIAGKIGGSDALLDTLTVTGGGRLRLTGKVSDDVEQLVLSGRGTVLALGAVAGKGPGVQLGDGTVLEVGGDTRLYDVFASGSSTINIAQGATLSLDKGFLNDGAGGTPARVAITGGGTVQYSNGSSHGIPLPSGNAITIGTAAQLNGTSLAAFQPGDLVEVTDVAAAGQTVTASYDKAGGQLVLRRDGVVVSTLSVPGKPDGNVTVTTDAKFGTLIGLTTPTGNGGDLALRGPQARAAAGVDGTGIVVGVISTSFNTLGGLAQDKLNGELPGQTKVLSDKSSRDSDEGREMAQLIHKIAPGASILFAASSTATDPNTGAKASDTDQRSEQTFANALNLLVKNGARVIVDDMRVFEEAYWQPGGTAAQAIAAATATGVVFVTSAGNSGKAYYEHALVLSETKLPGVDGKVSAFDFNLGKGTPSYFQHVQTGADKHTLDLQWALPQDGSGYTLTLHVFKREADGSFTKVATEGGGDGNYQLAMFSDVHDFYVAITSSDPAATGLFKYIVVNDGQATIDDPNAGQGSGTIFGHKLDANEITVGAVSYKQTPAGGVAVPVNEVFSSFGPGEYLFDAAGNRLATPQILAKPDVSGVDAVATDVSGSSTTFDGTSAAAPSVAAVIALMLQANPHLTTAQVRSVLAASALPMPGAVATAGAGLVQADAAVALAATTGTLQTAGTGQVLQAGKGPDTLVAGGDGAHLIGGSGQSLLLGSRTGPATLTGGTGGTAMVALGGPTLIQGGAGHDTINAALGSVTVASGTAGSLVALGTGPALVHGQGPDTIMAGSGAATIGTAAGSLVGLGTGAAVVLAGSGSTVIGGAGSAFVGAQGAGGVTMFGGSGPTLFLGGAGSSVVNGGTGSATVFGGAGGGVFAGGAAGGNVLVAGQGATTLFGGGNGDVLYAAGPGGDMLVAGAGNETLQGAGSTGDNVFFAGSGTTLIGLGAGRDVVMAGSGASTVIAGSGMDTFAFAKGSAGGSESIVGFKLGTDRVSLAGYAADEGAKALAKAVTTPAGTTLTLADNTRISFLGLGNLDARIFG